MSMPNDIFSAALRQPPIYGGFNKSKNSFGGFAELKTAK